MNVDPILTLEEAKERMKGAVAPRVTEDAIKAKIASVHYLMHGLMTICIIVMKNGFKFVGHSSPASPKNFDGEIGKRYAYDNAFRQIWTHEGYLLRENLHEQEAQ